MSDQGAQQGARRRSISESGHPRLNRTSNDDELFFNNAHFSVNQNNLGHQSQQIISNELTEDQNLLRGWELPADSDQQAIIAAKFDSVRVKIANWRKLIDDETITYEGIKDGHEELKGAIHSLYQEALYA